MHKIEIALNDKNEATQSYPLFIGENILEFFPRLFDLEKYHKILVVTDSNVAPLWIKHLSKSLSNINTYKVIISAGEENKNIRSIEQIWEAAQKYKLDRKSLIINLGGGVIGDMGGFAAVSYLRGIDFIQVPTTLLAQVDASLGGKLGVNFNHMKNSVGMIQHPQGVIIDTHLLSTLPDRSYRSGFSEIVKHALIKDKDYFDELCGGHLSLNDIILRSCQIKQEIIEKDERELGPRKLLNFGHTIAHALEAISFEQGISLLHGEAVAIGIMGAAYISCKKFNLSPTILETIEKLLMKYKLPTRLIFKFCERKILEYIKMDKKNSFDQVNWTLLTGIGLSCYDQKVCEEDILDSINFLKNTSEGNNI